jgi:hypothetical protein
LNPATRSDLLARYEPDIRALEEVLGEDLSIWRQPQQSARSNLERDAA